MTINRFWIISRNPLHKKHKFLYFGGIRSFNEELIANMINQAIESFNAENPIEFNKCQQMVEYMLNFGIRTKKVKLKNLL